ncbi:SpoIVB peptidase [Symbiobacterium thermophilum]|uniref:Stage IV sporulation protein B n=1 Tax=Symbiobacterium thermophilum (strain DSM 24528 / JCM 14929 / IAM 14863 / T) TaxID=292459 RepID=Q67NC5_SYMTH|nr:SpoIVB peptidase [Symbiobacterium thermophilum]BAD40818.1 stage IV sporulation protein B [Symbiobacterium thermophilum IAM 14863]
MSTREKWRRAAGLLLVVLILSVCATPEFRTFVSLPDHLRLPQGQAHELSLGIPFSTAVPTSGQGLAVQRSGSPLQLAAEQTGRYTLDVKLFGLIPIRRMTVDVVPEIRVVPGGHSIGVRLQSDGVQVVGFAAVEDEEGRVHHPGRAAGLQVGDTILAIDGRPVRGEDHAVHLFQEAGRRGREITLTVRRGDERLERTVKPVREKETGRWRVGLYIRDGASGVGTLTFYHPPTRKFGALGHVIAEGESRRPFQFAHGQITAADVVKIQKGRRAAPGEKITSHPDSGGRLGVIEKNTPFGIFGRLNSPLKNPLYEEPLPVAMASQVKEGPAEMLTVVDGQKIERFQVEIVRLIRQPTAEGKNMIVQVTDPRLLEATGGIVQGMSGSPIIQDGRVVGAVTHVFVNDPTRGYGVLIEWMLQEAGLLPAERNTEPNQSGLREDTLLPEVLSGRAVRGGGRRAGNVCVTSMCVYL